MRYVLIITCILCSMTSVALTCHGADPVGLHEGYSVLMFAVYPGCPACEDAMVWLGRAANTHPGINALLICPCQFGGHILYLLAVGPGLRFYGGFRRRSTQLRTA